MSAWWVLVGLSGWLGDAPSRSKARMVRAALAGSHVGVTPAEGQSELVDNMGGVGGAWPHSL